MNRLALIAYAWKDSKDPNERVQGSSIQEGIHYLTQLDSDTTSSTDSVSNA